MSEPVPPTFVREQIPAPTPQVPEQNAPIVIKVQDGSDVTLPVEYKEVTKLLPSRGIPYPKGTRWFARPYYFEEVLAMSDVIDQGLDPRSEEHTSELQSLSAISYAVFCLKKP